jgi:hypothetical protein
VEDLVDVVLVQDPDEGVLVGQVGQRDRAAVLDAVGPEARGRVDVTPQRDDRPPLVQQPLRQPSSGEPLRACDKRAQGALSRRRPPGGS